MKYQVGACSCKDCKSACKNKPGWFAPSQIEPLAKKLGLTVKEFFKQHLQIDWWDSYPKNVYVLSPRQKHGTGGTMFPANPKGECHWFKYGKCSIHTLGKPMECQMLGHPTKEPKISNHEKVMRMWKAEKHQKMIRDLYGAEPEAEESSFFDSLSW